MAGIPILKEFSDFLRNYKIVDLAIGFIMGFASKDLVKSVVDDLIMPLVNPLLTTGKWEDAILKIGVIELKIGSFISNLINFLIICFVVFVIFKKGLKDREYRRLISKVSRRKKQNIYK